VRAGVARLPSGVTWRHLLGVSMCAGIGFTVALFVSELAFEAHELGDSAKLGILVGSALAGVLGFAVLRTGREPAPQTDSEDTTTGRTSHG
jgi:Na+:H+ antiporter, NhaA family